MEENQEILIYEDTITKTILSTNLTLDLSKYPQLKKLYCNNDNVTKIINIPDTLTHLILSVRSKFYSIDNLQFINKSKKINKLDKITHLSLGYHFNQELNYYSLKSLKCLTISTCFNHEINNLHQVYSVSEQRVQFCCPLTLKYLIFSNGSIFNKSLNNLPFELSHLIFSGLLSYFNQKIDNLPYGLNYLHLSNEFNQEINNLPISLEYLLLRNKFDQKINNLPNNLVYFSTGTKFNQEINNLPNSLFYLEFSDISHFNQTINNLPNSLKRIRFGNKFKQLVNMLPFSIKYISIYNLEQYKLFSCECKNNVNCVQIDNMNEYKTKLNINQLPKTIKNIEINYCWYNKNNIISIPEHIENIFIYKDEIKSYINNIYHHKIINTNLYDDVNCPVINYMSYFS